MADDKYVHGATELRAHADAAVALHEAVDKEIRLKMDLPHSLEDPAQWEAEVEQAEAETVAARKTLREAFLAYTNPFGVVKTFS